MKIRLAATVLFSAQALLIAQTRDVILAVDLNTHLDPIARFDGVRWGPVPATGPGQLSNRMWTRWYAPGNGTSVRLSVAGPTGRCDAPRRLAVSGAQTPPPGVFDARYVGVAISSAMDVDSLRRMSAASPEWQAVAAAIGPLFDQRAGRQGVSSSSLARVPMTIDSVFAASGYGAATAYYFEASKRIPDAGGTPTEDPKGVLRIAVTGWLRASGERIVPSGTKSELAWIPDDESSSARPMLLPLGVLRQGSERVWVMSERLGSIDRFTLYSQGTSVRTLLTVNAAQC
ncbi:MAG TPA: hypothetical protein VFV95_21885 [Vicinamibacterales bacterium]|nr:hypothetical protein [Vicinamibacterales bacterium]